MRLGAFALCLLVLALAATTVAGCVGCGPSQAQTVSAASGQADSSSQGDSTFEELESTCDDLEAILEILETDSEQDSGL